MVYVNTFGYYLNVNQKRFGKYNLKRIGKMRLEMLRRFLGCLELILKLIHPFGIFAGVSTIAEKKFVHKNDVVDQTCFAFSYMRTAKFYGADFVAKVFPADSVFVLFKKNLLQDIKTRLVKHHLSNIFQCHYIVYI